MPWWDTLLDTSQARASGSKYLLKRHVPLPSWQEGPRYWRRVRHEPGGLDQRDTPLTAMESSLVALGFDSTVHGSRRLFAANGLDPDWLVNAGGEALPFDDSVVRRGLLRKRSGTHGGPGTGNRGEPCASCDEAELCTWRCRTSSGTVSRGTTGYRRVLDPPWTWVLPALGTPARSRPGVRSHAQHTDQPPVVPDGHITANTTSLRRDAGLAGRRVVSGTAVEGLLPSQMAVVAGKLGMVMGVDPRTQCRKLDRPR